jgi:nucleoside-diphosphate-sugar epimerase
MPVVNPSDGPVAVTGASGYVGSHTVAALLKRGYTVHACVTDAQNPDKTDHLLSLEADDAAGRLTLFTGNIFEPGSYDDPFDGCCAVLHAGTAMSYGGRNGPREVYNGAVEGTKNVLDSIRKAGSVKRLVYTSSFSAIYHPEPPSYQFTEKDWASDKREKDKNWNEAGIDQNGEVAYSMAKEKAERYVYRAAEEDGRFDAVSVCPIAVLGPLLCKAHELVNSWQWFLGQMLEGKPCVRSWKALWNIVDVRDVGQAEALILESSACKNGSRYQLGASNDSGEINVLQLQAHLLNFFPDIDVGGAPDEVDAYLAKYKQFFDAPRAHCDLARAELGLRTHKIEDTLRETGATLIDLGLVEPAWKVTPAG